MGKHYVKELFTQDGVTMIVVAVNDDGTAKYSEVDSSTGDVKPGVKGVLPALTSEELQEEAWREFETRIVEEARWNPNYVPAVPTTELVSYFDKNGRYIIDETEESKRQRVRFEIAVM